MKPGKRDRTEPGAQLVTQGCSTCLGAGVIWSSLIGQLWCPTSTWREPQGPLALDTPRRNEPCSPALLRKEQAPPQHTRSSSLSSSGRGVYPVKKGPREGVSRGLRCLSKTHLHMRAKAEGKSSEKYPARKYHGGKACCHIQAPKSVLEKEAQMHKHEKGRTSQAPGP